MLEICKYLIDELKSDSSLTSLTGATVSDSRIYAWKPGANIVFSTSVNGAIYYHFSFEGKPFLFSYPSQIPDASITFRCASPIRTTSFQIAELLSAKFEYLSFSTTNYRIGVMTFDSMFEGVPEGDASRPVYIFDVNYDLKELFKTS